MNLQNLKTGKILELILKFINSQNLQRKQFQEQHIIF